MAKNGQSPTKNISFKLRIIKIKIKHKVKQLKEKKMPQK
jgi:hypothetical protein